MAVPAKGISDGFQARNIIVGNAWSSYDDDERKIFSPAFFERLAVASHDAFALTKNPGSLPGPENVTATPAGLTQLIPLTTEEVEKLMPVFKRRVNINKVMADIRHGRLCRHSGRSKSKKLDKLMKGEINKVIRQVGFFLLIEHHSLRRILDDI